MDKNKLLYFIKDRGYRVKDFCELMEMSYSVFYAKCRDNRFLLSDIWEIAKFLNLSLADINSIFFADYVS